MSPLSSFFFQKLKNHKKRKKKYLFIGEIILPKLDCPIKEKGRGRGNPLWALPARAIMIFFTSTHKRLQKIAFFVEY